MSLLARIALSASAAPITTAPEQPIGLPWLSATTLAAGDVDGDGDADLVVGAWDDLALVENLGGGAFAAPVTLAIAYEPCAIAPADLDVDGDLDLLWCDGFTGALALLDNLGGGAFGPSTVLAGLSVPYDAAAADLDGDGDLDLLGVAHGRGELLAFENLGGAGFDAGWVVAETDGAWDVEPADLDGDGDPDLVLAGDHGDEFGWIENLGAGALGPFEVMRDGPAGGARVARAADLDGDGDLDLLGASAGAADLVYAFENLGGGLFGSEVALADLEEPRSVDAADLDGDGDLDLVLASHGQHAVLLAEQVAPWTFDPPREVAEVQAPERVIATDLDGDADPDVAVVGGADGGLSWVENLGTAPPLLDGDGDGVPDDLDRCPTFDDPADADGDALPDGCDDGDGDGLTDHTELLAGTDPAATDSDADGNADGVDLCFGSDDLADTDADGTPDGCETVSFTTHVLDVFADLVDDLDAADLDGDGDLDLLASWPNGGRVVWYENLGGAFAGAAEVAAIDFPSDAHAADLDADGDLDVAIGDWGGLWRVENLGGAVWGPLDLVSFTTADALVSADLPGGGPVDLVSFSSVYDRIEWYAGPDLTPAYVTFAGAPDVRDVHPVDWDGDGLLDLLGATQDDDAIAWWRAAPGGGWEAGRRVTEVELPQRVTLADIDGDGADDLVVTSVPGARWLRASGGWASSTILDGELWVAVPADLDADGILDVVTADGWHRGRGAGLFEPMRSLDLRHPRAVVAADLDGDGDLDLAGASYDQDAIVWAENIGVDTDGDALSDADEASIGSDPLAVDSDGDGLGDGEEVDLGTDPTATDSDGDGLSDPDEIALVGTDPTLADTDGDGAADGADPCPTDAPDDSDGDGACDADDRCVGYDDLADIDGDGIPDGCEPPVFVQISIPTLAAWDVAGADLDADGDVDLLAAHDEGVAVHANGGGGLFVGAGAPTAGPGDGRSIVPGDLDLDGLPDVAASFVGTPTTAGWLRSTGAALEAPRGIGGWQGQGDVMLDLGDLDADGDLDAVLGGYNVPLLWYKNDGTGAFVAGPQIATPGDPTAIATGDLDLDGDLEVLVARSGDRIDVYRALPGGYVLGQDLRYADFGEGRWILTTKLGDLDGDGDPDLLTGGVDGFAAWENVGGMLLERGPVDLDAVEDGLSVAVADVDGDGVLDAIGVNAGSGVSWARGDGGLGFGPPRRVGSGLSGARAVDPVDLEGDGDVDLVVGGDSGLEVFENVGPDTDGDGEPDATDPCPVDREDDTDQDGVCDTDDRCQGFDDGADADADGVPDGCEPPEPGPTTTTDPLPTTPGTPPEGKAPPKDRGCGCATGASPAAWLAVVALAGVRRARRARSGGRDSRRPTPTPTP